MLKGEFSSYSIILFALVIVLITFMLARIISSESRNIGTLMALGYRRSELAAHYVLYALLPTVIGGFAGVLISIPFSKAFTAFFFNDFDSFPFPQIWERVKTSLPPNARVLMIGDTLGTDIFGAKLAGFDTALVIGRNVPATELAADETALGIRPDYYLEA